MSVWRDFFRTTSRKLKERMGTSSALAGLTDTRHHDYDCGYASVALALRATRPMTVRLPWTPIMGELIARYAHLTEEPGLTRP